jgi:isopentenyl-diphosphate delta-isomerase
VTSKKGVQFSKRKLDHLRLANSPSSLSKISNGLDKIRLIPDALSELNFNEINISSDFLGHSLSSPFFISSMTAGHKRSLEFNSALMSSAQNNNWLMGVGSQSRELNDSKASIEWKKLRKKYPKVALVGNIGIGSLLKYPISKILTLTDALEPLALIVHLNVLQELFQPEGDRNFKGSTKVIAELIKKIKLPVIVKEVGMGLSPKNIQTLYDIGVRHLDVAGAGGTNWALLEGQRTSRDCSQAFADFGIPVAEATMNAVNWVKSKKIDSVEIWASGGVTNGVQGAKLLALGATRVGFARIFVSAAEEGAKSVNNLMNDLDFQLKATMMATGIGSLQLLKNSKVDFL